MKSLIIEGYPNTGKTKLAKKITDLFKKKEVAYLRFYDIKCNSPFLFTSKTKLVVIDDVDCLSQIRLVYETFLLKDDIIINRKFKKPIRKSLCFLVVCCVGGLSFEEIDNYIDNAISDGKINLYQTQ